MPALRRHFDALLLVAGLAVSCGGKTTAGVSMDNYLGIIKDDAQSLRRGATAHSTAVSQATDMAEIAPLETSYNDQALSPIDDMRSRCLDVSTICRTPSGKAPDATLLIGYTDQVIQECTNHRAAMAGATDLAAANTEEARHQTALVELLLQVDARVDVLAPDAERFICGASGPTIMTM